MEEPIGFPYSESFSYDFHSRYLITPSPKIRARDIRKFVDGPDFSENVNYYNYYNSIGGTFLRLEGQR
jgi:hypothetical protein